MDNSSEYTREITPRKPTKEEIADLVKFTIKDCGSGDDAGDTEHYTGLITESSLVAVYDNYSSSDVGRYYDPKIIFILWEGDPSQYEVYVWDRKGEFKRYSNRFACGNCRH
jgi:hypothetical protein